MAFEIRTQIVNAVIASGTSLSAAIPLQPYTLVGIMMDAGGWDAASLTFQASADDSTFGDVHSSGGTELSFTVAAGQYIAIDPATLRGFGSIKVRSGASGAAVNQTAQRTLKLITRVVY